MTESELQAIKDRIRKLGVQKIRNDPDSSEEFARLYRKVFKKQVCSTCPGKLERAWHETLSFNIKTIIEMAERRFNFKKKGIMKRFVNPIAGVPDILNNKNLRDEYVPLIIAANPAAAEWFTDAGGPGITINKPAKAEPVAEPTALELRKEEIDSLMGAKEIKAELDKLEISYKGNASKVTLVNLLAEATTV